MSDNNLLGNALSQLRVAVGVVAHVIGQTISTCWRGIKVVLHLERDPKVENIVKKSLNFPAASPSASASLSDNLSSFKGKTAVWNNQEINMLIDTPNRDKREKQIPTSQLEDSRYQPNELVIGGDTQVEEGLQVVSPEPNVEQPTTAFEDLAKEINEGLSALAPKLVTVGQLQAAFNYIEIQESNPEKKASLKERLKEAQASGSSYVVLKKEETGLSHNIEYHGPGQAFLRYQKNFAQGGFKTVSKMVSLYEKELIVKAKMIITQREGDIDPNLYRRAMGKADYATMQMTYSDAETEASLGKGVEGVLQNKKFVNYTKEVQKNGKLEKVNKAAIYSIAQKGPVNSVFFNSQLEKSQAAMGMIKNVAAMHRKGFCHNDIKGANFLWNRNHDGEITIKTIDLGLMTSLSSSEHYQDGTKIYHPKEATSIPESNIIQRNKAKEAFALGVAIVYDLYAISPFKTDWSVSLEKLQKDPKFLAIDPPMQEVILGLLDPNPETRMTPEKAADKLFSTSQVEVSQSQPNEPMVEGGLEGQGASQLSPEQNVEHLSISSEDSAPEMIKKESDQLQIIDDKLSSKFHSGKKIAGYISKISSDILNQASDSTPKVGGPRDQLNKSEVEEK